MTKKKAMNLTIESNIESKVLSTMAEFTKASPMGSITTGMLSLLIKPDCTTAKFAAILDHMEEKGLLVGTPKGKTKRWRLD
jgi:thiol:disulfide interchange protein